MIKENRERVYLYILGFAAASFMVMPFINTFNEMLTRIVEQTMIFSVIQEVMAPFIVKILVTVLRVLGIPALSGGSNLYLTNSFIPLQIYINWNCIGWQSFILLVFTLVTGLQGSYSTRSKILTIIYGLEGTFLLNIIRILIPTLLAYFWGYVPAVLFHDYMGTALTLLWLGLFWKSSFSNLLVTNPKTNHIRLSIYNYLDSKKNQRRGIK
ncbi:MAG: archaeosortase/exosortase family protein [Candidatus Thorarchaeota archaeon]